MGSNHAPGPDTLRAMLPSVTFELIGLLIVGLLVWLIWDSLRAREAAVSASRAACEAEGYQFLDDTVAIESMRPARNDQGQLTLRRIYGFEYSDTGNTRHKGSIVMVGATVLMLRLGRHQPPAPLSLF
jgi:hypothetical protein